MIHAVADPDVKPSGMRSRASPSISGKTESNPTVEVLPRAPTALT